MKAPAKTPCRGCPFLRNGPDAVRLSEGRIREIAETDGLFPCHKTTEAGGAPEGTEEQVCMGWATFLYAQDPPLPGGNSFRIMGRLGMFDVPALENCAPLVFSDLDEAEEYAL